MDPTLAAVLAALFGRILLEGPQVIINISEAWSKEDPSGQDYQALADAIDALRPKDPLGKIK